jgi:hypothetical protein
MTLRKAGIAAVLALLAAAAAYWWWMRPERQIQGILDDVAATFTHDGAESGLEALAAVAAVETHLASDVSIQAPDSTRIDGRQEAITAAARVRAATRMMRLRFFDPRITFAGDASATVAVTIEVTRRTESGKDLVDVHDVTATIQKSDDRWVVSSARIVAKPGA